MNSGTMVKGQFLFIATGHSFVTVHTRVVINDDDNVNSNSFNELLAMTQELWNKPIERANFALKVNA